MRVSRALPLLLLPLSLSVPAAFGQSQGTVSLQVSRHIDACQQSLCMHTPKVLMTGRVHGVADPNGLVVDIVAYSPDYAESTTITAKTNRHGDFQASFRPSVNVRLTAALAAGQAAQSAPSRPQRIIVLPKRTLGVTPVYRLPGRPRAQRGFTLTAYAPLYAIDRTVMQAGSANRAYFYAGGSVHGRFRLLGSARFSSMGWGTDSVRFTSASAFPYTSITRHARYFFACTRGTIMKGMGLASPKCGHRTLGK